MTQQAIAHPQPAAHSRRTWVMIILVICLTTLAIWLVPDQEATEVELPPLPATITEAPPTAAGPTPLETLDEPAFTSKAVMADDPVDSAPTLAMVVEPSTPGAVDITSITAPDAPGGIARRFLATLTRPDPEAAMAEAEKQQQTGRLVDAYLLYFYAARLGNDQAALVLARQADPAFHSVSDSPLKTPVIPQALRWYDTAAEAGNPAAITDRQQLRSRIELAATNGDINAQRLTLQWQ